MTEPINTQGSSLNNMAEPKYQQGVPYTYRN